MTWKARRGVLTSTAARGGAGGGNSAEVTQFFSRISATSAPYTAAYIALIDGLVADGVWTKLEALGVWAAPDETTALTNVKSTGTFTKSTLVGSGITHVPGDGFVSDVSNYGHIDSGIAVNAATLYARNSAHIGTWRVDTAAEDTASAGFLASSETIASTVTVSDGGRLKAYINDSSANLLQPFLGGGTKAGHAVINRSGASARQAYYNGSAVDSDSAASVDISGVSINFWFMAANNSGAIFGTAPATTYAFNHFGSSLDATQTAALYSRLNTFLAAVP